MCRPCFQETNNARWKSIKSRKEKRAQPTRNTTSTQNYVIVVRANSRDARHRTRFTLNVGVRSVSSRVALLRTLSLPFSRTTKNVVVSAYTITYTISTWYTTPKRRWPLVFGVSFWRRKRVWRHFRPPVGRVNRARLTYLFLFANIELNSRSYRSLKADLPVLATVGVHDHTGRIYLLFTTVLVWQRQRAPDNAIFYVVLGVALMKSYIS